MAEPGRGESSLRRGTDSRRAPVLQRPALRRAPVLQRPALRWAAVAAGVAVVAGSATQAVGTLAAPLAVRTATQNVSTANYFPAPLPTNLTCTNNGIWGSRSVTLNWTAPPRPAGAAAYRYRVTWLQNGVTQKYTFDTANTTTGAFRIRDQLSVGDSTGTSFRITVKTINPADTGVVSSGFVGWTVESPTAPSTRCLDNSGTRVENAAWENQLEWSPGATAASERTGRMFVSLADELDSGALAEVLPPEDELGGLTDVPPPAPTPEQTPDTTPVGPADGADSGDGADPSGADTSTAPGDGAETGETSTPAAPGGREPGGSAPTPSGPAAPGAGAPSTGSPGPESPGPESPGPGAPGSGSPDPDDSSGPITPTGTAGPTVALGAGPLEVGAVEARLEEVDGRPVVTVSSGGVQVCAVSVPGATAIANSGGALTVLGAGADRVVDTATCEVA